MTVAEKVRTPFLDTGVVSRLHGGGDNGDEFAVDVFLLRVDGLADRVGKVFEDLLVYAQLLLEHVQTGDVGPVMAGTGLDFAVEVFDQSGGVAGEGGRDGWSTA